MSLIRVTLGDIAREMNGTVEGDADFPIASVRALDTAGPQDLSFVTNTKYLAAARTTAAGALILGDGVDQKDLPGHLLVVEDPQRALAYVLDLMFPAAPAPPGVHPTAIVGAGCVIGHDVSIGPYCVIGDRCTLGEGSRFGAHVTIGPDCRIGAGSVLHARSVLYDNVTMGKDCIIHSGAVLGADGFGFASATSLPVKMRQVGRVVLGDEVEIGANSTIDRATLEETRVGSRTKIDNLVQVGHNVHLGEGCLLCGQSGIAGSAKLGDRVVLAGQSGIVGHLSLGDGVQVAAKSAVMKSVDDGQVVGGVPAIPLRQWQRQTAALSKLGELRRRVAAIERKLDES